MPVKKLLNTLYVMSEDVYLALDGENVVVLREDETAGQISAAHLGADHQLFLQSASPALMGACARKAIGLCFYTPRGRFLARTTGMSYGNVLLRKEQYRISDDDSQSLSYSQAMILGKVFNCRWILERTARDHGLRVDSGGDQKSFPPNWRQGMQKIRACDTLDTLRGIEGELASRYFAVFDDLIINQKDDFQFHGRSRRPPLDNVNALLSFAYALLGNDCANALEGAGLDAYVGFLHRNRPGRQSLALDLMEELRGVMADRFVLTLINRKIVQAEHFDRQGNGAVLLSETGRKQFLSAWQQHKKETITHPFLEEKLPWGLVPHVQAMLLARTIRGDLERYPPFLWK